MLDEKKLLSNYAANMRKYVEVFLMCLHKNQHFTVIPVSKGQWITAVRQHDRNCDIA